MFCPGVLGACLGLFQRLGQLRVALSRLLTLTLGLLGGALGLCQLCGLRFELNSRLLDRKSTRLNSSH